MKELLKKIWEWIKTIPSKMISSTIGRAFIIAAIVFDTIGGCGIPLAYGCGDGWFAIPNLIVNAFLVWMIVRYLKTPTE